MASPVNGQSVCALVHNVVTNKDDADTLKLVTVIEKGELSCLHEKCDAAFKFVKNNPELTDAKITALTQLLVQKEKERPRSIVHFDSGGSISPFVSDSE